jgi:hypothetical protein
MNKDDRGLFPGRFEMAEADPSITQAESSRSTKIALHRPQSL